MGKMVSSIAGPCVVMALVLLAACTGAGPTRNATSSPSIAPSPAPTTTPPAGPFLRTCQASVYGDLGKDWRKNAVVVGPIAFLGFGSRGTVSFSGPTPVGAKYRGIKALAVVDEGVEVTVSVAPEDRGHAALLYDPSAFRDDGLYSLGDGESSVVFQSCAKGANPYGRKGPTQFNGGFIVDGPQCVTLNVVNAASGLLKGVNIAFGRSSCAAA